MNNIKTPNKTKNIKYFDTICTFLIIFIMIIIILNPKRYATSTIEGIKLFFYAVLPGLFPFMLLTKLLTELGIIVKICSKFDRFSYKIFGTNGLGLYCFFMSIISGYPIGAKIISDLYSKDLISEYEAKKMSVFCTTSGPAFVIGSVGTIMFKNYNIGLIIYFSHIISSLLLGIIFNIFSKKTNITYAKKCIFCSNKPKNIVNTCINDTINSLFIVCAYITIFFLIGEIFEYLKIFDIILTISNPITNLFKINKNISSGIFYGILEVTRGAKTLSNFSGQLPIILATGLISFSGFSIIFQSMAFLKNAKIKMHKFVLTKFIHSIFSMIICYIIINIIF